MSGLPTVQVLLDDGTGTFPHDVTAYARLLDGFSFKCGRDDGQDAVTAGALTLAFNNADGRFTPGSTVIATPSPITVDQRIRLKETVNGTTFTRFTGYVKSWRVGWPAGVDTHSVVQVTATDAQARAERRVLKSIVEEEILSDGPEAYYTLGEREGSTSAADSSGNQKPPLGFSGSGAVVTFGTATGPGTDGLTAASLNGGQDLRPVSPWSTSPILVFECAFLVDSAPGVTSGILPNPTAGDAWVMWMDTSGHLIAGATPTTATYADGQTHFATVFYAGFGVNDLYIDGALAVSSTAASFNGPPMTGTLSHLAYFQTLSSARAIAHATAALTGFAGESGTDRITRLAGYADIPLGTLDTSLTNVAHKPIGGTSAWSAIADVTNAEGGLSLVDGSGNLVFTNRNDAPEKVAPDLSIAASFVQFDAAPTDDDAEILNYLEATAEGTGAGQLAWDATSEGTHGRYSDSKSYLVQTDAEALDRANWIVANYAEPTTRFGTLTINLFGMSAAQQEAVIANAEPGAWLQVTDMPAQTTGGTTVDVMIQGIAEQQSASEWTLTCNVVARSLFTAAIYDNATYGVYGESKYYY